MADTRNSDYTSYMASRFRTQNESLGSFFCREDYAEMMEAVRRADADARHFRMSALNEMCRARGLTAERLLVNPELLDDIPTRKETCEKLLEVFHELYAEFPRSSDYMRRLVSRLAPEYAGDSVRAAILKKFLEGAWDGWRTMRVSAIVDWAVARLSPADRARYDGAAPGEKLKLALSAIDDSLFTPARLEVELEPGEQLALMARRLDAFLEDPAVTVVEGRTEAPLTDLSLTEGTAALLENFLKAAGETAVPLRRADRLRRAAALCAGELPEDAAELLPELMDALEPEYNRQLRAIRYTGQNGRRIQGFERYKTDARDLRDRKRADWDLLRLCDDLAAGRFRTNGGKTKVYLYHFAIMFHMTVALRPGDAFDPTTDLVKNLFEDYYSDDLLRFLEEEYNNPRSAGNFEREPTGEGVNFKNFIEVIYLYCICRNEQKLTPGRQIDRARRLIDRCVAAARAAGGPVEPEKERFTQYYRRLFVEQLMDMDEDALVETVARRFLIISPEHRGGAGVAIASEAHTAYDILSEAMEDLEDAYDNASELEVYDRLEQRFDRERLEEMIEDVRLMTHTGFDWELAPLLRARYADDPGFVRVVDALDARLTEEYDYVSARERRFLCYLLWALYHFTDAEHPAGLKKLKKLLFKREITVTGRMISEGARVLAQLGLDVRADGDGDGDSREKRLFLGERDYGDPPADAAISAIPAAHSYGFNALQRRLEALMDERLKPNKRVTRARMLSVLLGRYVALMDDMNDIVTFPELYRDFADSINPSLVQARYQPLSEKNLMDMYVVLSLYLYFVQNGK